MSPFSRALLALGVPAVSVFAALPMSQGTVAAAGGQGEPRAAADQGALLSESLGCPACHAGLVGSPATVRARTPSLSFAGERYRPEFLYAYLGVPHAVRPHIAPTRMPDFGLDERERVGLVRYLATRRDRPGPAPVYPEDLERARPRRVRDADAPALLRDSLGCLTCHALDGSGARLAPALETAGARLAPEWIARFLAAPHAFDSTIPMPATFYAWDRGLGGLTARRPDAAPLIRGIVEYLESRGADRAREARREWDAADRRYGDVTPEEGRRSYEAFQCDACHGDETASAVGPDLSRVTARLRPRWLRDFLQAPTPVRPAGFGSRLGSRMPHFRLSDGEADAVLAELPDPGPVYPAFAVRPLTAFETDKARGYIADRFPCLGCHRLDGEGGRIGPDLSGVGARLEPSYIQALIADPQAAQPGIGMPRHPMPADRVDLLVHFLSAQVEPREDAYMSPIEELSADLEDAGPGPGAQLYRRHCSACHGPTGDGSGYNAANLPTPPTAHADSATMATRPDDTLFDGIYAGGYILGKSHRMPAFGDLLTADEIRSLVGYIRQLCHCEQPAWAAR